MVTLLDLVILFHPLFPSHPMLHFSKSSIAKLSDVSGIYIDNILNSYKFFWLMLFLVDSLSMYLTMLLTY